MKLFIRQRKNSLFYATEHSAYIASMLTSLIATCLHAGVNALEYLVSADLLSQGMFRWPLRWDNVEHTISRHPTQRSLP